MTSRRGDATRAVTPGARAPALPARLLRACAAGPGRRRRGGGVATRGKGGRVRGRGQEREGRGRVSPPGRRRPGAPAGASRRQHGGSLPPPSPGGRRRLRDDGLRTPTSAEQTRVEDIVQEIFDAYRSKHHASQFVLQREKHFHYLKRGLRQLSSAYECLDASRPWLCYWILHSLELLDEPVPDSVASDVCQFLSRCQSPKGGFGGGPGQYPHLAPTYAAVNTLCIIGTEEAFGIIDRKKLLEYLHSLKQPDGSFLMHEGGEVDVRSAYCAASVASLTNLLSPTLFAGTAEWIARCQNWEGGIGGVPGMEAHGGYTFCGMAALVILGKEHLLDLRSLLRWVTGRQMRFEGGFQGRCNKLVDGCYSFWQAGLLPLLHRALHARGDTSLSMRRWMFDQLALQEYILLCCQCPAGGLLDKPGKSRDFYHTCYCLSGLAIAQHFGSGDLHQEVVLGVPENRLQATHPVYNIGPEKVTRAVMHFLQQPLPTLEAGGAAD